MLDPYGFVFYTWGVRREAFPMRANKNYTAFKDRMVNWRLPVGSFCGPVISAIPSGPFGMNEPFCVAPVRPRIRGSSGSLRKQQSRVVAGDRVVAGAAVDQVVAVEGAYDVGAADEDVVAVLAVDDVVALLAEDDVVAVACVDEVVARAGEGGRVQSRGSRARRRGPTQTPLSGLSGSYGMSFAHDTLPWSPKMMSVPPKP